MQKEVLKWLNKERQRRCLDRQPQSYPFKCWCSLVFQALLALRNKRKIVIAEKELDCRGLACPNPVIKTKEVIGQGELEKLTVLVDNRAAEENVSRFLQRSGYEVRVEEEAGTFA